MHPGNTEGPRERRHFLALGRFALDHAVCSILFSVIFMSHSKQIIGLSLMTWAWILLVAVTMTAWWLADGEQGEASSITVALVLTASVKIWIIGYQFMELKIAPAFLRIGFLLWLIAISFTVLFLLTN